PRELQTKRSEIDNLDWINREYTVENFRVFPYGYNNDLPSVIREVVQNNSIAPGILKKKAQLIWGKGPKLYKETFTPEGVLQRQWVEDAAIMNWLESWGFEDYLIKANVDYCNIEGVFTKFYLSKGSRIYKNAIGKLEHVSPEEARLAVEGSSEYINVKPTHCI